MKFRDQIRYMGFFLVQTAIIVGSIVLTVEIVR